MRLALLAGLFIGILCPIAGTFLIVQRIALIGSVAPHSVLPGLVLAHALRLPLLLGASVFGIYLSYYFDLPSGAAIALTLFVIFWFNFLFSPQAGLLNCW